MDKLILDAYRFANLVRGPVYILIEDRQLKAVPATAFRPQPDRRGPQIAYIVWPDDWQYRPQSSQ